MTTGERIRTRRKQLGMSVDDLAAKLGKNRATAMRATPSRCPPVC